MIITEVITYGIKLVKVIVNLKKQFGKLKSKSKYCILVVYLKNRCEKKTFIF